MKAELKTLSKIIKVMKTLLNQEIKTKDYEIRYYNCW